MKIHFALMVTDHFTNDSIFTTPYSNERTALQRAQKIVAGDEARDARVVRVNADLSTDVLFDLSWKDTLFTR